MAGEAAAMAGEAAAPAVTKVLQPTKRLLPDHDSALKEAKND
jgi:hypothetical protein